MNEQLSPETLRDWERAFALRGFIYDHADAWEADIERAEEAERVWFQEGYAQAEQKCEADRKRLYQYSEFVYERDLGAEFDSWAKPLEDNPMSDQLTLESYVIHVRLSFWDALRILVQRRFEIRGEVHPIPNSNAAFTMTSRLHIPSIRRSKLLGYAEQLSSIPEIERERLFEGDWYYGGGPR